MRVSAMKEQDLSLEVADRLLFQGIEENIRSVLLVTTAYHMRRSLAIARYLFPEHITIIPCPANDNNTRRDNWMNTSEGMERVKVEAMNIVRYVTNGMIPDFEI